jgi:poly(A) polymerase
MPVITPAYPSMCATFNITRSSMTVIQRELERGFEITEKIVTGKRPWSDLFVKHTFFTSGYKYYISVIATSKTEDAHKIWSGYVESKVRMLVQKLEQHPSIALAHAFNKGYERRHKCRTSEEILQVQEGSMEFLAGPEAASESNGTTDESLDNGAVKADEPAIKQGEDGAAKDGAVAEEPANKQSDDTVAKDGAASATAKVDDEDKTAVKEETEDGGTSVTSPPQVMEIFTTTHYIGLELAKSRSFRRQLFTSNKFPPSEISLQPSSTCR